MAVYEFKCLECGHITPELRKISDFKAAVCTACGSRNTEKIFSLVAGAVKDCRGCTSARGAG